MARRPRADGTQFAINTAADLASPLPEPLFPLSERGMKYWPIIIGSKRPEAWTESDLFLAGNLAEDYGEVERLRTIMQRQPPLIPIEGKKGRFVTHPALELIGDIQARIISTCRALQIHALATVGLTHHQRGKNQAARELATVASREDRLFARPRQDESGG